MPREIVLASDQPVTAALLVQAAVQVDDTLVPRVLFAGWVTQLVDGDDVAVLSIELSRPLDDLYDVERLTGLAPEQDQIWWTEATAPWGPSGTTGVRVARALAELMLARIAVQEGA